MRHVRRELFSNLTILSALSLAVSAIDFATMVTPAEGRAGETHDSEMP
jgi:hypothetical protein